MLDILLNLVMLIQESELRLHEICCVVGTAGVLVANSALVNVAVSTTMGVNNLPLPVHFCQVDLTASLLICQLVFLWLKYV